MASSSDRIFDLAADQFSIGLSSIFGLTGQQFQSSVLIKYGSGGSLLVGGATSITGSAFSWSNGYLMGTNEVIAANCGGDIKMAAVGATVTVFILKGLTNSK